MSTITTPDHLLGATARWTASVRALESARPDRLFDDPWAATLAGAEGAAWMAARPADSVLPIVLRTRFFDDFLQRIAHEHGMRQIVLLGSGLDTRAFRLEWPAQTRFFELDQPAVLSRKERILQEAEAVPTCALQCLAVNLSDPWQEVLLQAGFDPEQPAGWLLEGFLFYLANERMTSILDAVSNLAAPASWLGFDIINPAVLTSPWTRAWVEMQAAAGAPWIGTLADPVGFMAARGWNATLSQAGAPDANHGRWHLPLIPTLMPDMPHNWYVCAEKQPAV